MTKPDYSQIIDALTWGFIARTDASYPSDTVTMTISDQRRIYDTMCRVFFNGYPPGVTSEDRRIGSVPCRVYPGAAPTVLYLHGGGFVVGGLDSHDDICAEIRARTGLTVVSADYRLCPEHPHPAAYDDAVAVATNLLATTPGLILVGDSAGGNLAAATAHHLRHAPGRLLGQVLIYPGLGGDRGVGSYLTHANAPMLTSGDIEAYAAIRFGGTEPAHDPTAAPLQAPDFTGLPPTLAISAECDPLADDARHYTARVTAAGGRARWVEARGLVHGYLRARNSVPRAAESFALITDTITAFAAGIRPIGDPT